MMPIASNPKRSRHQASCSSVVSFHGGGCCETTVSPTRTGTSSSSANSLANCRHASVSHHR